MSVIAQNVIRLYRSSNGRGRINSKGRVRCVIGKKRKERGKDRKEKCLNELNECVCSTQGKETACVLSTLLL